MSDTEYAPATSKKRRSDTSTSGASSKKARSAQSSRQALVAAILKDANAYPVPEDDDGVRKTLVELAQYARSLEGSGGAKTTPVQKAKTKEEIAAAAVKLRAAAVSGIKKQMSWKPSCKTGTAKFAYDGVCTDPEVFGAALGLAGPPTFKMKKIPKYEFQDAIGTCRQSVRYDTLSITGNDVTVRWQPEEGTFKFSGSYGRSGL